LPAVPSQATAPWIAALWYLAGGVTLWAFGYTIMRGSDLWWHLAAGGLMAERRSFLYTDPWSYTFQGKPWLDDAWLSDLIYHWWAVAFGLQSLAWWKWSVLIATYLLLMRTLHRVTGDLLSAFAGAVLAIAIGEQFLDIRPHLYSLLGFSVLLSLTLGRERPSGWLPVLFLVWVQLHAMFVFGLMALAVLLVPSLIRCGRADRMRSAIIGVTSTLACLINPNFITVFTRPIRYALTDSPYLRIGEWRPPFAEGGIYSPPYPFAIGLFVVACMILLIRRPAGRARETTLAGIVLGALTLAMSLKSRRFVPLFGIAQSIVLALALAPWVQATLAALSMNARRLWSQAMPLMALGLGFWWLWPFPAHSYAFHYLIAEDTFPVETVNFIRRNRISGKVFSYYNWGGYLHARIQGAMKVFIDGRADMVFDDDTYLRYVSVLEVHPGWLQIIEDSGAEYVLWPKKRAAELAIVQGLLQTRRWRVLYEDYVSALLERTDRPLRQDLAPTPETAWRELALGSAALAQNGVARAEMHFERALDLMPFLGAACFELARSQGAQGRIDDARKTVHRCHGVYPNPAKRDPILSWLDRASATAGK
jgi:hypothetical protein